MSSNNKKTSRKNSTLSGARITKFKGVIVSVASMMGLAATPLALLSAVSLASSGSAHAACVVAGTEATCSGTILPVDLDQQYRLSVDGVTSLVLDPTLNATALDTSGFRLRNRDAAVPADLSITLAAGAVLNRTGGFVNAKIDALFLQNRGSGSNTVDLEGDLISSERGLRLFSDSSLAGELDKVTVAAGANIDTEQTAIWVRHDRATSLGGIEVNIDGNVNVGTVRRAVQISANGVDNASDIVLNVGATGVVTSADQGLFVGNAGTGRVKVNIDGSVTGGSDAALAIRGNNSFDLPAAIIVQAETGGSDVTISSTGIVESLNDRAIVDSDKGLNNSLNVSEISIVNDGSLTGYVDLRAGDDTLANNGTWSLRNYADTTGDGIRDTKGIANSDFGDGADALSNLGLISLGAIAGDNAPTQALFSNLEQFNNDGTIDMQNGVVGDNITTDGDYAGTGELLVDVDFTSDTSDTLDIGGDITGGSTTISVQDLTVGQATGNDVTVVNFGGTSNPGDFILEAPVVNGAFNYNTLAQDGQTWELQTRATPGSSDETRAYTPIASAVEGLGRSLLTLESLPTLNQRQSIQNDRERLSHPAPAGTEPAANRSVWMRIVGGEQEQDSNRSTTGADFDTELWRVQAGANRQIMNNDKGRFVLGLNGSYSEGDTNVSALAGRSSIDTEGLSVGVTGTWYAPTGSGYDGLYVDTQAQRSSYVSDISGSAVRGATNNEGADHIENIDSDGLSFSVEMGQRIALESENDLSVTPQAQLVYSKVDFDGFTGRNNVVVESDEAKSLQARVGLTVDTQIRHQAGSTTQGYLLANVLHEFEDGSAAIVSGARLSNDIDRWRGEIGGGVSHVWETNSTTSYEVFGEVLGSTSLNNVGDSNGVQGTVGFRVLF